jgi:hypothetical protein
MPTPIQTFDAIVSVVLSSDVGSFSITSIPQTYDHLVITGGFTRNLSGDFGGRSADFQWNGITSGYRSQAATIGATSPYVSAGNGVGTSGPSMAAGNRFQQGGRGAGEIWIPWYKATNFQKHCLQFTWQSDTAANNGGYVQILDTIIPTTGALTSLFVSEQVDTFVNGDWLTIYGVKNA